MSTLHLVSHTHWDREWYLPFQLFRLKLVHLMDNLLALLAGDENYRYFTLDGQTIVLEDYLQLRPEREAELRQHIQSGRLLIGPWHVLPDEFLVSPEAIIRNLMQGERTARRFAAPGAEHGSYKMQVGYIPDPFGHIGQMPQILQGFGIQAAALQRGLADEPCEFWWQAPDGSRVLMAYLREGYGSGALLPVADPPFFVTELARLRDALAPHAAASHRLIMHGTDHMEPVAETPAAVAYANEHLDSDRVVHSTLPAFLAAIQAELDLAALPVVAGELRACKRHNLLPAVLSARVWIKQRNHACETLLEQWAEPFSTLAGLAAPLSAEGARLGDFHRLLPGSRLAEPAPILRRAWHLLMENHPHDSICGCSVDQVHHEMAPRFDQVEQIGTALTHQSLEALAAQADTNPPRGDTTLAAIVVFNPLGFERTDAVTASVYLPEENRSIEIVDEAGQVMPHSLGEAEYHEVNSGTLNRAQLLELAGSFQEGSGGSSLAMLGGLTLQRLSCQRQGDTLRIDAALSDMGALDLAALSQGLLQIGAELADETLDQFSLHGYTATNAVTFVARGVPSLGYKTFWVRPAATPPPAGPDPSQLRMENEFLSVRVSEADGAVTLEDKRTGAVIRGLNRFEDGGDAGDEYNYAPPAEDELLTIPFRSALALPGAGWMSIELTFQGELPAGLTPGRQRRAPERVPVIVRTTLSLLPGVPRLEVHTEVENLARDHRLQAVFATGLPASRVRASYDGHFEIVERPLGVPAYDETWQEQPRPEQPMRDFVDVSTDERGLMVANRGLREVEVRMRPDGEAEIALTLLRCVGWLSRDDFSTRRGHAGPALETPGAQMIGTWSFDYAILPHASGWLLPAQQAYAFNAPLRSLPAGLHPGVLPSRLSFVQADHPAFQLSALKTAEDGQGWIVRGYNLLDEPIQVNLIFWQEPAQVFLARLDETPLAPLTFQPGGHLIIRLRAHEIVTLRLK